MPLTTVAFNTTFQFEAGPPKTFQFEDTTDYAGQGVALADVTGILKIISPDGLTFYNNISHATPDIDPDVSLFNANAITLPLLGDGTVQQGDYIITYEVQDTSGTPFEVSLQKTLDLQYVSPVVDLDMTADCIIPLLDSTDNTPYTVGGVTPVIVRDHRIQFPASTNTPEVTGTGKVLSTNTLFSLANQSLQHSSSITSTLTYTFAFDFIVTDSVSGNGFIDVTCDAQLCDLYCCIRAEFNRFLDAIGVNQVQQNLHFANWQEMIGIAEQIRIAQDCGKGSDIPALVDRVLKLGNCEAGCGCDDGEPQLVTGLGGGSGITVVDSGGVPIIVTPVINGNTTTYTVSLEASFVSKVNGLFNTTLTAGANVTITPTIDGSGNIDYLVDFTPAEAVPDILSFKHLITINDQGTIPVFTVDALSRSGSAFDLGVSVDNDNGGTPAWLGNNTQFTIKNIWSNQGAKQFKTNIDIIDFTVRGLSVSGISRIIDVQLINNTDTEISFIFVKKGQNITGQFLNNVFLSLELQITLVA